MVVKEYVGEVVKRPFGTGSKSEHLAVWLEAPQGRFVLRRQGGNAFYDPELEDLVGSKIRCKGILSDYVLHLTEFEKLAPPR